MTEKLTLNQDTSEAFSKNNEKISRNIDKNVENFVKNSKNTAIECKNERNFDTNLETNLGKLTPTSDSVSNIGDETPIKNQPINFKVLSDEEDKTLFSRLFPAVSREDAENDRLFKLFASGRKSDASFTSIYSDYTFLVSEITKDLEIKQKYAQNNKTSSPGALSSSEAYDDGFFTKEQVLKMSREQIARNYDKIRKSQQKW